eukprot:m.17601 g.17601  ORF g.17601 m.17601 type:complete len:319 (+) comp11339_c0_seq1:134-1090(+)
MFSLTQPQYDQSTYFGRFRTSLDVADPRCLVPSVFFGMSSEKALSIIESYKQGNTLNTPIQQLWLAKKIVNATYHPDTGEKIIPPFRMCGFAVFGTPIIVGMLMPNPSLRTTIFYQTINQTHNAGVNYANRNASQPTPLSKLVEGYLGAVLSSVGIAVGLNQLVARSPLSVATRTLLSRFVPFPAVATASSCNMFMMRRNELHTGIDVKDADGTIRGVSKVAAKQALKDSIITRIVLPAPLLLIPPTVMMMLPAMPPRIRLPVEAAVCTLSFVFGLPMAIAVFPQEGTAEASNLEPEFHHLTDTNGAPITQLYYNKGL